MNFFNVKLATIRPLPILIGVLLLSSCSLFQAKQTVAVGDWAFRGKMAIRNAEQASSFNVDWLQQGDFFQIELSGPLGQGAVTIKGSPGDVTLRQNDNVVEAYSLADLAYQQTELDLPLDHLQYWVRALPDPISKHKLTLNQSGQTATIAQSGWTVSILEYFEQNEDLHDALPRKLSFARADDSGKLIIREWTQAPQPSN